MPDYYLSDATIAAGYLETLASSAPSSRDTAQGWTVDKKNKQSSIYVPDTVQGSNTLNANNPSNFTGYGYRSENAGSGSFATGSWTLYFKVRNNSYSAQKGRVLFRLWRSATADGSGGTQITSDWVQPNEMAFTAANQDQAGSVSVAPGSVSLNNEYLFLEILWLATVSGGNNSAAVYWVHNEGAAERLSTLTFTGTITGTATALASAATGAAAGVHGAAGSGVAANPATLAPAGGTYEGVQAAEGSGSATCSATSATGQGKHGAAGAGAAMIPTLAAAGAGGHGAGGTAADTMVATQSAGLGFLVPLGSGVAAAPTCQATGAGSHGLPGGGAVLCPASVAAATGEHVILGAVEGSGSTHNTAPTGTVSGAHGVIGLAAAASALLAGTAGGLAWALGGAVVLSAVPYAQALGTCSVLRRKAVRNSVKLRPALIAELKIFRIKTWQIK